MNFTPPPKDAADVLARGGKLEPRGHEMVFPGRNVTHPHETRGRRSIAGRGQMATTQAWEDPIPLRVVQDPPGFPVDALPDWVRDWVAAEAHATQTPPDMAGMLALAVLAACCGRRFRVRVRDGWCEPTNIYTCVVLPPGNRKSAVFRDAMAPLELYEREWAERMEPEIAHALCAKRVAEERLKTAQSKAARSNGDERGGAEQDARDAIDALRDAEAAVPVAPRLVTGDATQEGLARLLDAQGGCIAVMDAEGCGPLAIMLGRYAQNGGVAIDLFLRGHAGETYRSDRAGRDPIIVPNATITLAVTMQPEMLRQLGERRELRGLGLLARMLWCVPASTVGQRVARPEPMPQHVRSGYEVQVRRLLDLAPTGDGGNEQHMVRFSVGADDILADLQERIEPQLRPGSEREHMADWASKLSGAVARVAGLLHAAEHVVDPWKSEVSAETARRATVIGEYLFAHARAAFGSLGASPTTPEAEHVLSYLRAHAIDSISRRNLHRALRSRFPRAGDLVPALDLLAEHGFVRVIEVPASGATTRTTPHIEVHPSVWADTTDGRDTRDTRAASVPSVPRVQDPACPDDIDDLGDIESTLDPAPVASPITQGWHADNE